MKDQLRNLFSLQNVILVSLVICYVLASCVTNISFKITINHFQTKYSFFVVQFMNILYVFLGFGMLAILYMSSPERRAKKSLSMKGMFKLQGMFFLIAILDSCGTLMQGIGNQYTPGQYQTLLTQLTIPITMVASYYLLKARFSIWTILGALIIIGGVLVTVIPSSSSNVSSRWYSMVIYSSSTVFFSFSFIWKEYLFKEEKKDFNNEKISPYDLTTYVAVYMVPITFLLYPIQAIPGFGGLAVDEMLPNLKDGVECLGMDNGDATNDLCDRTALIALLIFSVMTFVSGVLAVVITAKGSAVLQFLANAAILPLTNIGFSLRFVMGSAVESFSDWSIGGLIVVVAGFLIYSVTDYYSAAGRAGEKIIEVDEEDPLEDGRLNSAYPCRSYDSIQIVPIKLEPADVPSPLSRSVNF